MDDQAIAGPSQMSRAAFINVLTNAGSPAAADAGAMYDILVAQDVRAEILLAFFRQESQFGTKGVCKSFDTHSPGNVRSPEDPSLMERLIETTDNGEFAKYATWVD